MFGYATCKKLGFLEPAPQTGHIPHATNVHRVTGGKDATSRALAVARKDTLAVIGVTTDLSGSGCRASYFFQASNETPSFALFRQMTSACPFWLSTAPA